MKILILDNYDSFTYNLVHMVEDITGNLPDVFRNDEITVEEITRYDVIILSPGPGIPDEAGILKEVIATYAGRIPIFGVCLGLQAITEVFGGKIENMGEVFHGVATEMEIIKKEAIIFKGIPEKFEAARYHSWIASNENFPRTIAITAVDEDGGIQAIEHKEFNVSAVQFHPESILTEVGEQIIRNFLENVESKLSSRAQSRGFN